MCGNVNELLTNYEYVCKQFAIQDYEEEISVSDEDGSGLAEVFSKIYKVADEESDIIDGIKGVVWERKMRFWKMADWREKLRNGRRKTRSGKNPGKWRKTIYKKGSSCYNTTVTAPFPDKG